MNVARPFVTKCWLVAGVAAGLVLAAGCGEEPSALEPEGPAAARIADHWWLMFSLAVVVYLAVVGLLLYAIIRSRRQSDENAGLPVSERTYFAVAGLAIPSLVLLVLIVDTVRTEQEVGGLPEAPAVTIDIIGHQFWWEVHYPNYGIVTANEIHIPVGQPIEIRLTSADVIHSFWVPSLAGKRDLNPGQTNVTWLQADEPGVYRGQCAEFCGIQHTFMDMLMIAEPMEEFEAWVDEMRDPITLPDEQIIIQGQEVFVESGCALCHDIEGSIDEDVTGTVGPNLRHLGSRLTLAAGIIENNPENLAQWILNPHEIKPGVRMPPTPLEPEELEALVAFLLSLE